MAQEQTVHGAAEKITGLLNPKEEKQKTESKAEPSETPVKQEAPESQPESEGTKEQVTENTELSLIHI